MAVHNQREASARASLSITIVGSTGKMGAMLMNRLAEAGHAVCGVDREAGSQGGEAGQSDETPCFQPHSLAAALAPSQYILVCVPATAFAATIALLVPHLRPDHVLMDITSIKAMPVEVMEAAFSGAVIGTHPLFGPCPRPEEMRVALVRGQRATDQHCADCDHLFISMGCTVFWCGAEEHDRGVGVAQSLNFALSAAYFTTLARSGDKRFFTPSFRRHLEAARKHLTEDADMFCEFTSENRAFPHVLEEYSRTLLESLEPGDSFHDGGLARLAREAAVWYAEKTTN